MPYSNLNITKAVLDASILRTQPYISLRTADMDEALVSLSYSMAPLGDGLALIEIQNELKIVGVNILHPVGTTLDVIRYMVGRINDEGFERARLIDYAPDYFISETADGGEVFIGKTLVATYSHIAAPEVAGRRKEVTTTRDGLDQRAKHTLVNKIMHL